MTRPRALLTSLEEREDGWYARCACGWSTGPAWAGHAAARALDEHLVVDQHPVVDAAVES